MNQCPIIWSYSALSSPLAVSLGSNTAYSLGDLESIVEIIGEVEVRIIEGNCVDGHKAWREVNIATRRLVQWKVILL